MKTDYYRIARSLFSHLAPAKAEWEEVVGLVDHDLLELAEMQEQQHGSYIQYDKKKKRASSTCSRARTNARKLAAAQMHNITPLGQKWFRYDDGEENEDDSDGSLWLASASETTLKYLAKSNFYETLGMFNYDRVFGTASFLVEYVDGRLVSTFLPFGTYAIGQNEFNEVDTLVRKFTYTAHQAAHAFGEDALTDKMRDSLNDDARRYIDSFEIWHIVTPRKDAIAGVQDVEARQRKWASVFMCSHDKKILMEDGYYEFPYCVSRFMRKGSRVYGTSPAAEVMKEMRDYPKHMDAMRIIGQRQAIPSILTLAEEVGEIDMRAGGQTIVSEKAAQLGYPREWGGGGRFDIGIHILEQYKDDIDNAFYIPIIETISSVDRYMTATEVNAREAEKVMTFTPSFVQYVSDFAPIMRRILALLLRAGVIPLEGAPSTIVQRVLDKNSNERIILLKPQVSFLGRMAQAIDRAQKASLDGTLQELYTTSKAAVDMGMANPLDHIDLDYLARWRCLASAMPIKGLRPAEEVAQMRKQKAEAAAAMQEAQMEQVLSQANKNNADAEKSAQPNTTT